MDRQQEDRILQIAVEKGIIFEEEIKGLARDDSEGAGKGWGSRLEELIRTGRLAEPTVAHLEREADVRARQSRAMTSDSIVIDLSGISKDGAGSPAAQTGGEAAPAWMPGSTEEVLESRPGRHFGKYEIGALLGQGGMGEVYKAYDTTLKRAVALKFLHVDNLVSVARLFHEARAQAQIEHEVVCRVYEVGQLEGEAFIAMQYIPGTSLDQVAGEMTTEQKLDAMRQVAEGVHAAHRTGLIHRDLKPGNILVCRTDEGQWKPYVMDFGIAREMQVPGVTATGVVMGTLSYMSPEQARGEVHSLDRRTDVYSLGATLYEILAGRPPFSGKSRLDMLVEIMQAEVPALRKVSPRIPRDVETIVMKCLEKDPDRRYESAKALADDLRSFLEGEPIHAQRASAIYRITKKLKKNRAAVTIISAASLAVLVSGGIGLRARWTAAERARTSQEFGQKVERIEWIMDRAYLLPLHDTRADRRLVNEEMRWVEDRMKAVGGAGYGPGYYALGRGSMALGDYQLAEKYLDEAWRRYGYRDPPVAYALGVTMAMRYREELAEAERLSSQEVRDAKRLGIEAAFRGPALEYIRKGRDAGGEGARYVQALLAFVSGDYAGASKQAEAAAKEAPWGYDAERLMGDAATAMGNAARDKGHYAEAMDLYGRAERAYQAAIAKGRSDPANYESLCGLAASIMEMQVYQSGESPATWYKRALDASDMALIATPQSAVAYRLKSFVHFWWAEYQIGHGEDARGTLTAAIEAGHRAIDIQRDDAAAYRAVGNAYLDFGEYEMRHGLDPMDSFDKAITHLGKSLEHDPSSPASFPALGGAHLEKGMYELSHGIDPRGSFERAISTFKEGIAAHPEFARVYINLGSTLLYKGQYEMDHGDDPHPAYDDAVRSYKHAIALNPKLAIAHNNLGQTYANSAVSRLAHGEDPRPDLERAIEAYRSATQINPEYASAQTNIGEAGHLQALYEMQTGADPRPSLVRAEEAYVRAIEVNPNVSNPVTGQEMVCWIHAEFERRQDRSPDPWLQRGRLEAARALHIDAEDAEAHRILGGIELVAARWRMSRRAPAGGALDAAAQDFSNALKVKADDARACAGLAEVARWRAEEMLERGRDESPAEGLEAGAAAARRALSINPRMAEALAVHGALLLLQARLEKDAVRRLEVARQAEDQLKRALEINPLLRDEYDSLLRRAREIGARP